jgi:hypothetical protein
MTRSRLSGMTVNERLGELGLFERWDEAVRQRDRDKMLRLMIACELGKDGAAQTVDTILGSPEKYGF